MDQDPSPGPARIAAIAAVLLLAGGGLFYWARYHAPSTSFLLWGLAMAILFSGTLTLSVLETVGALEVSAVGRQVTLTLLWASLIFLVAHFTALGFRRGDHSARLALGHETVVLLQKMTPLPEQLRELGLPPEAVRDFTYRPRPEGEFTLCFESPGGASNCYSSESNQWLLRP